MSRMKPILGIKPNVQRSLPHGQAELAVWLARCPAFNQWKNRPLKPNFRQMLRESDRQQLLSLIVHALLTLASSQRGITVPQKKRFKPLAKRAA